MIGANLYLRGELAARARDRGHEDVYRIALEEFIAQSKPYVDMKARLLTFTPKVMVFTHDGHLLLNDYPPEVTDALRLCDEAIANIHHRIFEALNTSRC